MREFMNIGNKYNIVIILRILIKEYSIVFSWRKWFIFKKCKWFRFIDKIF